MKIADRQRKSLVSPELRELGEHLVAVERRAKELGLFICERELLTCAKCGLTEDIDITSRLFTYRLNTNYRDTGLRFQDLGRKRFRCPSCGATVQEPNPPVSRFDDADPSALAPHTHDKGAKT